MTLYLRYDVNGPDPDSETQLIDDTGDIYCQFYGPTHAVAVERARVAKKILNMFMDDDSDDLPS